MTKLPNYSIPTYKDRLANGFCLDEGFLSVRKYATPVNKHPAKMLISSYAGQIIKKFKDARDSIILSLYANRRQYEAFGNEFMEGFKTETKQIAMGIDIDLTPIISEYIKKAYKAGVVKSEKHLYTKRYANTQEMNKEIDKNKWVKKTIKNNKLAIRKYAIDKLEKDTKQILDDGLEKSKTVEEIGRDIAKLYNQSAWKGIQIAQTELNRANSQAVKDVIKDTYKKTKERYYWWNLNPAASKSGVCPLCRKLAMWCKRLDGFSVMNKKHPLPIDDSHPHCFCFITPYRKK